MSTLLGNKLLLSPLSIYRLATTAYFFIVFWVAYSHLHTPSGVFGRRSHNKRAHCDREKSIKTQDRSHLFANPFNDINLEIQSCLKLFHLQIITLLATLLQFPLTPTTCRLTNIRLHLASISTLLYYSIPHNTKAKQTN